MAKDFIDLLSNERAKVIEDCKETFMQLTTEKQNLVIAFMMGMQVAQDLLDNE